MSISRFSLCIFPVIPIELKTRILNISFSFAGSAFPKLCDDFHDFAIASSHFALFIYDGVQSA